MFVVFVVGGGGGGGGGGVAAAENIVVFFISIFVLTACMIILFFSFHRFDSLIFYFIEKIIQRKNVTCLLHDGTSRRKNKDFPVLRACSELLMRFLITAEKEKDAFPHF